MQNIFGKVSTIVANPMKHYKELVDLFESHKLSPPRILPVKDLQPGQYYWKIMDVYHLSGAENGGKHNLYLEMVAASGERIRNRHIEWGWLGQHTGQYAHPVYLDKPWNEPGGNIALHNMHVWAVPQGVGGVHEPAEGIDGIHAKFPGREPGNTWGHQSFLVVWQYTEFAPIAPDPEPEPDPEPGEGPVSREVYNELLNDYWSLMDSYEAEYQKNKQLKKTIERLETVVPKLVASVDVIRGAVSAIDDEVDKIFGIIE